MLSNICCHLKFTNAIDINPRTKLFFLLNISKTIIVINISLKDLSLQVGVKNIYSEHHYARFGL